MTTQRKSPPRPKPGGGRKKAGPAHPARPAAKPAHALKPKAHPVPARPAARPGARPATKPVAAKAVPGKAVAGKAVAGKGAAAKGAAKPAITPVKGKPRLAVAKRTVDPTVRPLGVLPASAPARSLNRAPVAAAAVRPRPLPRPGAESARTGGAQRVTEKDYEFFEKKLLDERTKIMKEMGHLETTVLKVNPRDSAGDLSGYSFHMADVGTDAYEREKAFLFASSEGRLLMDIDDALRKLYRGEFGVCEICGEPIARARLEAMPYTRLCLACKQKEERESRGAQ